MMTEKCCDIGTVQTFLDGELSFEQSEAVAHHVAACEDCAKILAVAEEESAFAFSALEQEFNTLVPTQRLWAKINDSIDQQREKQSFWTPIFAFFSQPSIAAFAGLLIVAGLFAVILNRGAGDEAKIIAGNNPNQTIGIVPAVNPVAPDLSINQPIPTNNVPTVSKVAAARARTRPASVVWCLVWRC